MSCQGSRNVSHYSVESKAKRPGCRLLDEVEMRCAHDLLVAEVGGPRGCVAAPCTVQPLCDVQRNLFCCAQDLRVAEVGLALRVEMCA
jgi:hypothetical protein